MPNYETTNDGTHKTALNARVDFTNERSLMFNM